MMMMKVDEELRKKRRDWNRDVARMREEVIRLLPVERSKDSDQATLEPFVARRRGSTDCLDIRKMRTLFLEYPDGGRRCKLRFDVSGFDDDDINVTTDGERIIVRATTKPCDDDEVWAARHRKRPRVRVRDRVRVRVTVRTFAMADQNRQSPATTTSAGASTCARSRSRRRWTTPSSSRR